MKIKIQKLMMKRGISFELFADIILDKKYIDIIERILRGHLNYYLLLYITIILMLFLL